MSRMPRIVAITDSLGLPRVTEGTRIAWDDTWPHQLLLRFREAGINVEILNCGSRARTAPELTAPFFFEQDILLKRPDIVVLQVGIVDCAPRIFTRRQKKVISQRFFPGPIRTRLIAHRSSRRSEIVGRDPLAKVYTAPHDYEHHMRKFRRMLGELEWPIEVHVLPIVAHPRLDARSPGYLENVRQYNELLSRSWQSSFIDDARLLEPDDASFFADDGYHLGVAGNAVVADLLFARLEPQVGR